MFQVHSCNLFDEIKGEIGRENMMIELKGTRQIKQSDLLSTSGETVGRYEFARINSANQEDKDQVNDVV